MPKHQRSNVSTVSSTRVASSRAFSPVGRNGQGKHARVIHHPVITSNASLHVRHSSLLEQPLDHTMPALAAFGNWNVTIQVEGVTKDADNCTVAMSIQNIIRWPKIMGVINCLCKTRPASHGHTHMYLYARRAPHPGGTLLCTAIYPNWGLSGGPSSVFTASAYGLVLEHWVSESYFAFRCLDE
jgi:hypothetical protein